MFAVKYVCLISHETNGLIMIPKTVLKSGLWRCSKKYGFNSNCQENYLTLGSWCGFKSGFAFCKICLPNLARGYLSDHDSENCSEISAVTWFRIYPRLLQIPTLIFFTPPYSSWHCWNYSQLFWFFSFENLHSATKMVDLLLLFSS